MNTQYKSGIDSDHSSGLFCILMILNTENDNTQQHGSNSNHNAHAGLDTGSLGHEAHHRRGDNTTGGADQDHGADTQIVAPDAFGTQCQSAGVDGGHEQTHAHDADEDGQLASAEEHHQEEDQQAHAVRQQDVLSRHTAHQGCTDHPADENNHPQQAGHHLADLGAQDTGILEISNKPVDDGILRRDVEEQNHGTQPEILILQEAAVHLLDALGDVLRRQAHFRVDKELDQAQDNDTDRKSVV